MEALQELFGVDTPSEAIYWAIAVLSSSVLGIQTLLSLVGLDLDIDLDFDIGGDDVTLSAVLTFLGMGSWSAILFKNQTDMGEGGVLLTSLIAGIVGFTSVVFLINKMKNLENSGNVEIKNAIGKVAEVYLGIPESRTGEGQVQLLVQGRLVIFDALTDGKKIETGQEVIVYDVEEGKLLVELYNNKELTSAKVLD
ncbi:MAG: hypothetical protein CMO01_07550 [Thalassobius sp.]|nr:hypothetical protein [Thalassovita sp.]